MAAPLSSYGFWSTIVYPKVWTHNMIHLIILIAATVSSASLTTISSTSTSLPSFKASPISSTPSLIAWMIPNTPTLITSSVSTTALYERVLNESNVTSTISEEERRRYLDSLQEVTTLRLIPTVIFLSTLAVVGLIGNTLVLLVYSKKARRSADDIFIMAMAMSDLVANIFAIPANIHDTYRFWDLDMPLLCKFRVYVNSFTTMMSAQCLLAIAVSRYRKICRTFERQVSKRDAKIITIVVIFISTLVSIPNAFVYGTQTKTVKAGISGSQCFTDDKYINTIWPMITTCFLMVLFFTCCISLIVLYLLIGLKAWRSSKIRKNLSAHSTHSTSEKPKGWRLFRLRNKKKNEIPPGKSIDVENVDNKNGERVTSKPKNVKEQRPSSENVERAVVQVDDVCVKMMSSPVEVESPVGNTALENISLKVFKDGDIKTCENTNKDKESDKLKTEDFNDRTTRQDYSDAHEKSQLCKDGTENGQKEISECEHLDDCAATKPWLDVTSEGKNAKEKNDDTDDGNNRKNRLQSVTVLSHENLGQKLDDKNTLTGISEASRKSGSDNKMENPPKKPMTTVAECGNDRNVTFNLNAKEKHGGVEKQGKNKCHEPKRPLKETTDSKSSKSKRGGMTKTTRMLFIISAIFVIGFVPHLVLIAWKYAVPDIQQKLSAVGFAIYHVFLRFYFINSAANAIIYNLCDVRFRDEVKKIMRCKT